MTKSRWHLCRVVVCLLLVQATVAPADSGDNRGGAGRAAWAPDWAADAVWYQVFVSRFANGEPGNDPPQTLAWTNDWSRLELDETPPVRGLLNRRCYGGDLQGLRSKLPYLAELGVNALYLNPIFQADTQHKYDAADLRHIDDTFGVAGSLSEIVGEGADPTTWQFSASDRLFLDFLSEAHRLSFRVMIDGVFNHVGQSYWAWTDVKKNGRESRYAQWFDVTDWGPPIRWAAWDGPNGRLVRFRHVDDGLDPEVEAHLFAVVRRWMDPNGDGDTSDGVDGWRLDAADQVGHGFWRRFREVVKRTNRDAIILGEIWVDPKAWLDGGQFDVVTNYPFAELVLDFVGGGTWGDRGPITASRFCRRLVELDGRYPRPVTLAMLNLLDSHDTPRAVTRLAIRGNRGSGRAGAAFFDEFSGLGEAASPTRGLRRGADMGRPSDAAVRRYQVAALIQFTCAGAPMIYYGDEVGMYGGNDPFCRAPMWWAESSPPDYRSDLLLFHGTLCRLRREHAELRRGPLRVVLADDKRQLAAFARSWELYESIVLVNGDSIDHRVIVNIGLGAQLLEQFHFVGADGAFVAMADAGRNAAVQGDGRVAVTCAAGSAVLLRTGRAAAAQ